MTENTTKGIKTTMPETKKDIIKRTLPIFLERGVKTSMDEISQYLGISKRTIYENFENKDELIFQCIIFMMDEDKGEVDEYIRKCCNPIEELFPIVHENVQQVYGLRFKFVEEVERNYPQIHKEYVTLFQEKHINRIRDIIRRGKQQGLFKKEINEDIIIYFIPKMGHIFTDHKRELYGVYSMKELFINIAVPFMRGMATLKGIEIFDEVIEKYKKYKPSLTNNN